MYFVIIIIICTFSFIPGCTIISILFVNTNGCMHVLYCSATLLYISHLHIRIIYIDLSFLWLELGAH